MLDDEKAGKGQGMTGELEGETLPPGEEEKSRQKEASGSKGPSAKRKGDRKKEWMRCRDYGAFAMILACSHGVLSGLEKIFHEEDARRIYVLGMIAFCQEVIPAGTAERAYEFSILRDFFPGLTLDKKELADFIELLGRHPAVCDMYMQKLIDGAGDWIIVDGQSPLIVNARRDRADYKGSDLQIENEQICLFGACDGRSGQSLTALAYDSAEDELSLEMLFSRYTFREGSCLFLDEHFYGEEALDLCARWGVHFVSAVPADARLVEKICASPSFTDCFFFRTEGGEGGGEENLILYREWTIRELDGAGAETKGQREAGRDRLILYRDEDLNKKMADAYAWQSSFDKSCSGEAWEKEKAAFGLFFLRTNLPKEEGTAEELYRAHKRRWELNRCSAFARAFFKTGSLMASDYCLCQGLGFLSLTAGQIQFSVKERMKKAQEARDLSLEGCLLQADRVKLVRGREGDWQLAVQDEDGIRLLKAMGVDPYGDLERMKAVRS